MEYELEITREIMQQQIRTFGHIKNGGWETNFWKICICFKVTDLVKIQKIDKKGRKKNRPEVKQPCLF